MELSFVFGKSIPILNFVLAEQKMPQYEVSHCWHICWIIFIAVNIHSYPFFTYLYLEG